MNLKASRRASHQTPEALPGLTRFWGALGASEAQGPQKPPGLGAFQGLESLEPLNTIFWGVPRYLPASRPSPADLLRLGARTPQGGAPLEGG